MSARADTRPVPASVVYDVMKARGHADCVLPSSIRGLSRGSQFSGRAFTVEGHEDQALSAEETLLRWAQLLSLIPSGSVVVCQPNTHEVALMGELSARALAIKNVRAYVVDGACRDADLVEESGLPVFCTHLTPRDIVGRWTWTSHGTPLRIGTVTVTTGDLVVADRDGIVVVPHAMAEGVMIEAAETLETESAMRRAILSGADPVEAYLEHGKF